IPHSNRLVHPAFIPQKKKHAGRHGRAALVWNSSSAVRAIHRFTERRTALSLCLEQFRTENRFTLFLELL
ncbi:hypothetical protein, partial [Mesorhizobium sp. M0408]|uniref:hypothetical protein n=1 Tax=Mesorhizobium sp. M0408 TaxID=2956942 RepID=UPI003336A1F8